MKLADIKAKIAEVSPFLKLSFYGVNNCLCIGTPPIPLTVCLTPPSVSFIIETGSVTTLLLRYSDTYKTQLEKIKTDGSQDSAKVAQQVLDEVTANVMQTPEEQAKQLAIVSQLGREYLIAKAQYGYYQGPTDTELDAEKDRFKVVFTDNKELAEALNKESDDSQLAIFVDALEDMEQFEVGMSLMAAMPKDHPMANIPFVDSVADADGVVKEEVVATAPAAKVTRFPRDTRSLSVEDVPPPSRETVGDSFD